MQLCACCIFQGRRVLLWAVCCRWAMLAAVGCLIPEALSLSGVELGEPVWWKVGAAKLQGDLTLNWGGIEVRWLAVGCCSGSWCTSLLDQLMLSDHLKHRTNCSARLWQH